MSHYTKIVLNGRWVGFTTSAYGVYDVLRRAKRMGFISHEVSIGRNDDQQQLKINTDSGRLLRPLLIV